MTKKKVNELDRILNSSGSALIYGIPIDAIFGYLKSDDSTEDCFVKAIRYFQQYSKYDVFRYWTPEGEVGVETELHKIIIKKLILGDKIDMGYYLTVLVGKSIFRTHQ